MDKKIWENIMIKKYKMFKEELNFFIENCNNKNCNGIYTKNKSLSIFDDLSDCFSFGMTSQGRSYWFRIEDRINMN